MNHPKPILRELQKHPFDYVLLIFAGITTLSTIFYLKGERMPQFFIVCAFVLFYIAWGFHHHSHQKTLRLKTMLEYVLIGFTLLFSIVLLFIL